MINFNPFWKTLKEKNISTYKLEQEYGLSRSLINKLKHNHSITLNTLNDLCELFECDVPDIIEHTKEHEE